MRDIRHLVAGAWVGCLLGLVVAGDVWAARYRVGQVCADPSVDPSSLTRAVQYMYPRPAASGGLVTLQSVGVSSSGVLSYVEMLPSGSSVSGSLQLLGCNMVDCVAAAQTVSPCPSGFAPAQSGGSVAVGDVVAYSSAFDKLPQQDVMVALGLVVLASLGFGLGYRIFGP